MLRPHATRGKLIGAFAFLLVLTSGPALVEMDGTTMLMIASLVMAGLLGVTLGLLIVFIDWRERRAEAEALVCEPRGRAKRTSQTPRALVGAAPKIGGVAPHPDYSPPDQLACP